MRRIDKIIVLLEHVVLWGVAAGSRPLIGGAAAIASACCALFVVDLVLSLLSKTSERRGWRVSTRVGFLALCAGSLATAGLATGWIPGLLAVGVVLFFVLSRTHLEILKVHGTGLGGRSGHVVQAVSRAVYYSLRDCVLACIDNRIGRRVCQLVRWNTPPSAARPPRRIAYLAHLYMGDAIMQMPGLALLRRMFPSARISLLLSPSTAEVFRDTADADELLVCMPRHGHELTIGHVIGLLLLRRRRFDVCVLDCSGVRALGCVAARLIGAKHVIADGAAGHGEQYLVDESIPPPADAHWVEQSIHVIEHSSLAPLAAAGAVNRCLPRLPSLLRSDAPEHAWASHFLEEIRRERCGVIIGLHVGSASLAAMKRWPLERFAEVVDRLAGEFPRALFLAFKGPQENDMEFQPLLQRGCVIVTNRSLHEIAAIIARCTVLISNDSGLGHVAACMGTPAVSLFGPTNPAWVRPYQESSQVVRSGSCPPCFGSRRELLDCNGRRDCLVDTGVVEVHERARRLVQEALRKGGSSDCVVR